MNDRKAQYIHICGRRGLNFAVWLYLRLTGQGMKMFLVDCSINRTLITYASGLISIKGAAVPAEKWIIDAAKEYVLFYHEQEDLYTDLAEGVYLFFAEQRNIPYIKTLLEKLTDGALRLFEPALIPQLQEGRRTYLLILYDKQATGEYYLPTTLLDQMPAPFEEQFLQILSKNVLPYLVH